LARAQILYLTEIDRDFSGDATFPPYDPDAWRETSRESRASEGPDAFTYSFVTRERRET
jgi:dihydrofolate reductase